jgi:hypothetical protein
MMLLTLMAREWNSRALLAYDTMVVDIAETKVHGHKFILHNTDYKV